MDKEILIELYQRKDRKRKMVLNELYYRQIHSNLSQNYIASIINRDLGIENLIQAEDIRYCKFYFKKKEIAANQQEPLHAQDREQIQNQEQKQKLNQKSNLNQQDTKEPDQQNLNRIERAQNQEHADINWPVDSEFSYPRVSHQFKFKQK